jgi:nicotinate-nucleotide adenylyltransferase
MNKIGIFGGTFSPMHLGHLAVAKAALEKAELDKIYIVPAKVNPFRKDAPPALSDETRLEIIKLTCKDTPGLLASDIELKRGGVSYAIDTVKEIALTEKNASSISWIMGDDSLPGLTSWHLAEELFKLCDFIVYPRRKAKARLGGNSPTIPTGARITRLEAPFFDISSSEIRRRIKENLSLEGLVDLNVAKILEKEPALH